MGFNTKNKKVILDNNESSFKFLGVESAPPPSYEYDFKRKFNGKAVNVTNEKALDELIKETDLLANDDSKNEKIAIQFRAIIDKQNSQSEIFDVSRIFEKNAQGNLLDGSCIRELIHSYGQYLQDNNSEKNYVIEIIKIYYPLDKDNKVENVSDLGNLVEYSKDGNTWTVDCTKEVKPVPDFNILKIIKPMAENITQLRRLHNEDNQMNKPSGKNKKTIH